MMDKLEQKTNSIILLVCFYVAAGFIWQILELTTYGEVQPRIVDNVMSLIFLAGIVGAYRRGNRLGRRGF